MNPFFKGLLTQRLLWLWLLVWLNLAPAALAATTCAAVTQIPPAQCQILLDLYNSTNGPAWTDNATNNWNVTNTPCSWTGVTCVGSVVTQIVRDFKNLTGTLPSSLSGLTSLQFLDLQSNQLTGSIPNLSGLTSLQFLFLQVNQLTGSIPNLSGLTSLQFLWLGYNQLTGSIPNLSGLTSLQSLFLNNNQLTGSIPNLSGLTSLQSLLLGGNQLTGSIPNLSGLTSLQSLLLNNNQLTGSIPNLSGLTSLQVLGLSFNQLTGTVPSVPNSLGLGSCGSPGCGLFLDHNQLTGIIPDLSSTALAAPHVDLGCNQFTGETGGSATVRDPDWASTQFVDCKVPAAPSGLTATPVSATQINLSWTDNSTNETGFKIESPVDTLINTTVANATSYSHSGLTCNTTYTYRLTATGAFGDSAALTASATTASCISPPPSPPPTPLPPSPITSTDLTPYQETGLAVRVTIDGTGQGRVVSTTKGVDEQGIDCASATQPLGCQANFVPATSVILLPIPDDGSAFSGWGGHPDCNKESLFITGGVLCTAYFRTLIHPFTLTINGRGTVTGQGLTCTGNTCTGSYLEGTDVTLTIGRRRPMWSFGGWSGDCEAFNTGITPLEGVLSLTAPKTGSVTFLDDPNIPNDRDGNGDGLKDAYQDNVVSLPDQVLGNYITVEVDKNCTIDTMSTEALETLTGYDPKYQFRQELLYFDIICAKTKVTFYYHGITKIIRRFQMQKYGPKIPGDASTIGWYILTEAVFDTVTVGTNKVMRATYSLTDGEVGDNTGVDGHIIDPVGLAEGD